jgi:hypothetical protein
LAHKLKMKQIHDGLKTDLEHYFIDAWAYNGEKFRTVWSWSRNELH